MTQWNEIRELAAWGLDPEPDRERFCDAKEQERVPAVAEQRLRERAAWRSESPVVSEETQRIWNLLAPQPERQDVQREFRGLAWRIEVVDLRRLLGFQRRLSVGAGDRRAAGIAQEDWPALVALALPERRRSEYYVEHGADGTELVLRSGNPDFRVGFGAMREDGGSGNELPGLVVEHGSPFLEVGSYGGRWFLRDGYHRAWRLLRAGVSRVPAVVVEARTLTELGAARPWFFAEEILFGATPPAVTDFCEDDMVLTWRRPARERVYRVSIHSSYQTTHPVTGREEQHDEHCNEGG